MTLFDFLALIVAIWQGIAVAFNVHAYYSWKTVAASQRRVFRLACWFRAVCYSGGFTINLIYLAGNWPVLDGVIAARAWGIATIVGVGWFPAWRDKPSTKEEVVDAIRRVQQ